MTTSDGVGILSNLKAEALAQERHVVAEDAFVEIVVWRVPHPVKGSTHRFKYRLALVVAGECPSYHAELRANQARLW